MPSGKKSFVFYLITLTVVSLVYLFPRKINSANLTTTKDIIQSSRISFAGRVKTPTVSGSGHVWIYTTGAAEFYSVSTAGLKPGDVVTIGSNQYTIKSIVNSSEFTITGTLGVGDVADTTPIYYLSKPQHVITFNTASAIANGFFRVLLKAGAANSNNGVPDSDGFDLSSPVTLTPTNATGYTFVTSLNAATAAGTVSSCPAGYHCFEFHYLGVGGTSTAINLTIGNTTGVSTPIAPAPASAHIEGSADAYTFKVQNFPNGSDPTGVATDQTQGKIAVIEAVRVTATVDPTITFSIAGVGVGVSTCGQANNITTTATSVPFGTLGLNTFVTGSQLLTVSTNAINGYSVTAMENAAMSVVGVGTTIPDTVCNNPGTDCTSTTEQSWNTASGAPGFGYSLTSVSGAVVPFTTSGATFNARPFDAVTPQQIMSSTGVSNSHTANVCYRVSVDATQAAGDYENQITYTATASF